MKITLIGTTEFKYRMEIYKNSLIALGHEVLFPLFDDFKGDELQLMKLNLQKIKDGDEIHIFWNGRSQGTWGDFCMAFALGKKVKIVYLEPKSPRTIMEKYAEECEEK